MVVEVWAMAYKQRNTAWKLFQRKGGCELCGDMSLIKIPSDSKRLQGKQRKKKIKKALLFCIALLIPARGKYAAAWTGIQTT